MPLSSTIIRRSIFNVSFISGLVSVTFVLWIFCAASTAPLPRLFARSDDDDDVHIPDLFFRGQKSKRKKQAAARGGKIDGSIFR